MEKCPIQPASSAPAYEAPESSLEIEELGEAVARRTRSLLAPAPILDLERDKGTRGIDLSQHDLRMLCLALLDVVIDKMGFAQGATRRDVTHALAPVFQGAEPGMTNKRKELILDILIGALLNERERRQQFVEREEHSRQRLRRRAALLPNLEPEVFVPWLGFEGSRALSMLVSQLNILSGHTVPTPPGIEQLWAKLLAPPMALTPRMADVDLPSMDVLAASLLPFASEDYSGVRDFLRTELDGKRRLSEMLEAAKARRVSAAAFQPVGRNVRRTFGLALCDSATFCTCPLFS